MRRTASFLVLLLALAARLPAATVDIVTLTAPIADAAEPVGSGTTADQTFGLAQGRYRLQRTSLVVGAPIEGDVLVELGFTAGSTAVPGTDFVLRSGSATGATVAFSATQAAWVSIPESPGYLDLYLEPLGDALAEGRELVVMRLQSSSGVPPTYGVGAPSSATVTIGDEDVRASIITVDPRSDEWTSASAHPHELARAGLMQFHLTDGAASLTRTVTVIIAGTATLDADYALVYGRTTAPAAVGAATVSAYAAAGVSDIPIESAQASRFAVDDWISFQDVPAAPATSSLRFYRVTAVDGSTSAKLTVSPALGEAIPAGWAIMRLGRKVPSIPEADYHRMSVDIDDDDDLYFWVLPIDDGAREGAEAVTLTALVSPDYRLVSPTIGQVSITDDDAIASIAPGWNALEPGVAGSATISFTAPFPAGRDVEVPFTVAGTATAADYQAVSGTVTLRGGQTQTVIAIDPVDDGFAEPTETVILTLAESPDYLVTTSWSAIWGPSATINIIDAQGTVSVATSGAAAEPSATAAFVVGMAWRAGASRTATVGYAIGGTAAPGTDYATIAGGVLVFPVGTASQSLVVTPVDDSEYDAGETVVLSLLSGVGYHVSASASSATIAIADDEVVTGTVAFAVAQVQAVEGGTVSLRVARTSTSAVSSVDWQFTAGSATASDLAAGSATAGTLVWGIGVAEQTISLALAADGFAEGTQTFSVVLASPVGTNLGATTTLTVTVADDLAGLGGATVTAADAAEPASAGGFAIVLPAPAVRETQLAYSLSGGAVAGTDYAAPSGRLTFAAGATAAAVAITPIDDAAAEGGETVVLTLVGGSATTALTIADDDPAVVGLAVAALAVTEGGTATLSITRSGSVIAAVSATVATANGTALAGSDFTAVSQLVSWAANDTAAKTITLTALADQPIEVGEIFAVTLVPGAGATTAGGIASATVTITDASPAAPPPDRTIADPTQGGGCGGGLAALVLLAGGLGLWRRRR